MGPLELLKVMKSMGNHVIYNPFVKTMHNNTAAVYSNQAGLTLEIFFHLANI